MSTSASPSSLSRRGVILATAGGLTCRAPATAGSVAAGSLASPALAASAGAGRRTSDLVAVGVFPSYRTKVYGKHDAVLLRLGGLGVKRISHKLTPALATNEQVIEFTRRAYLEHGIKSWLTVGTPRVPIGRSAGARSPRPSRVRWPEWSSGCTAGTSRTTCEVAAPCRLTGP